MGLFRHFFDRHIKKDFWFRVVALVLAGVTWSFWHRDLTKDRMVSSVEIQIEKNPNLVILGDLRRTVSLKVSRTASTGNDDDSWLKSEYYAPIILPLTDHDISPRVFTVEDIRNALEESGVTDVTIMMMEPETFEVQFSRKDVKSVKVVPNQYKHISFDVNTYKYTFMPLNSSDGDIEELRKQTEEDVFVILSGPKSDLVRETISLHLPSDDELRKYNKTAEIITLPLENLPPTMQADPKEIPVLMTREIVNPTEKIQQKEYDFDVNLMKCRSEMVYQFVDILEDGSREYKDTMAVKVRFSGRSEQIEQLEVNKSEVIAYANVGREIRGTSEEFRVEVNIGGIPQELTYEILPKKVTILGKRKERPKETVVGGSSVESPKVE